MALLAWQTACFEKRKKKKTQVSQRHFCGPDPPRGGKLNNVEPCTFCTAAPLARWNFGTINNGLEAAPCPSMSQKLHRPFPCRGRDSSDALHEKTHALYYVLTVLCSTRRNKLTKLVQKTDEGGKRRRRGAPLPISVGTPSSFEPSLPVCQSFPPLFSLYSLSVSVPRRHSRVDGGWEIRAGSAWQV